MLRAAALTLLILVSVVVTLPLVDSSARESGRSVSTRRHNRVGRRHSRAWWRRYRARMRRKRAALRRKRALQAMRGGNLNAVVNAAAAADGSHNGVVSPAKLAERNGELNKSRSAWNLQVPQGWSRRSGAASGEMRFLVSAQDGRPAGEAALSVVHLRPSLEAVTSARAQRKSLAGVPLTQLRRTVIDKMIQSNGWVVNDMQREIGGRNVYIVLAQTGMSSDGRTPQLSWVFYFTEVDGRIYNLATRSLLEFADRISSEAVQLVSSFQANSRATSAEMVSGKTTK